MVPRVEPRPEGKVFYFEDGVFLWLFNKLSNIETNEGISSLLLKAVEKGLVFSMVSILHAYTRKKGG